MGIGNHRRQQTSNIKRISTKSFSHNRKSQILRSKKQSLSENYSPKATHPMTNLAPSERLREQFCQAHISTIDRPERRQRKTQRFRVRPVTHIDAIHITKHQTSLRAPITRNPLECRLAAAWPRGNHTDWLDLTNPKTQPRLTTLIKRQKSHFNP